MWSSLRASEFPISWMIGEVGGVDGINIPSIVLERKRTGSVAYVAMGYVRQDREKGFWFIHEW